MDEDVRVPRSSLEEAVRSAKEKTGRQEMEKEDLLILCCAEIARSYTRDEKGYRA